MFGRAARVGVLVVGTIGLAVTGYAQGNWAQLGQISSTLGNHDARVCIGAPTAGRPSDMGCPADAPTVVGGRLTADVLSATAVNGHYASFTTLTAGRLYGDGSGLTGITADATDRITSGTTRMVVISHTGFVSLTQANTNTGWFDPQRGLVTLGVSATGAISGTSGYFSGRLLVSTVTGTSAIPNIAFAGDADTGFFWSGSGATSFASNGGEVLLLGEHTRLKGTGSLGWANGNLPGPADIRLIRVAAGIVGIADAGNNTNGSLIARTISATEIIQVSGTNLTCTVGIPGAIRYNAGSIQYCNGTVWTTLAGGGNYGDRIVSGTSNVTVNEAGAISFTVAGTQRGYISQDGMYLINIANPILTLQTSSNAGGQAGINYFGGADDPGDVVAGHYFTNFDNTWAGHNVASIQVNRETGANTAYMRFSTDEGSGNLERMRIAGGGNVGIGIIPSAKLDVFGTISSTYGIFRAARPGLPGLDIGSYGASPWHGRMGIGSVLTLQTHGEAQNDWMGSLIANGVFYDDANHVYDLTPNAEYHRAAMEFINGGSIAFYGESSDRSASTTLSLAQWRQLERMRITGDGKVGIGTPTPDTALEVSGSIRVRNGTAAAGREFISLLPTNYGPGVPGLIMKPASGGVWEMLLWDNVDVTGTLVVGAERIGIGTNTPKTKLDVAGNISASGAIQVGTTGLSCTSGIPGAIRYNAGALELCDGATWAAFAGSGSSSGDRIISGTTNIIANQDRSLTFTTANTQRMIITEAGKVGIGTAMPSATLQVAGSFMVSQTSQSTTPTFVISDNGNVGVGTNPVAGGQRLQVNGELGANNVRTMQIIFGSGTQMEGSVSGPIWFRPNAVETMRLMPGGNIGMGTSQPSATLHVSGTARITSWTTIAANVTPTVELDVYGRISATQFVGDGSQLTGVVADATDRIVSGTTQLVVVSNTGFVSLTQAGTNTGWFDPQRGLVTLGVSATGAVSATDGYFNGLLNVRGSNSFNDPAQGNFTYQMYIGNPSDDASVTDNQGILLGTGAFSNNPRIRFRPSGGTTGYIGISGGGDHYFVNATAGTASFRIKSNNIDRLTVSASGSIGISTTEPLAKLDVMGTISASDAIQVGTSALTCTNGIPGAIRYNSGSLEYCNGNAWTSLASAGAAANPDRIISGTTSIIANQNSSLSFVTAGAERIILDEYGNLVGTGNFKVSGTGFVNMWPGGAMESYRPTTNTGHNLLSLRSDDFGTNTQVFTVRGGGATGIALNGGTPSATLHVSGTARINSWTVIAANVNPTAELEVYGTVSATRFRGDGSGLTGITADATDRIVSGTTRMVVVSDTGFVSLTQAGSNTGWFDPQRGLVALGVSATGRISGTSGYFGAVGIGVSSPSRVLHVRSPGHNGHVGGIRIDNDTGGGAGNTIEFVNHGYGANWTQGIRASNNNISGDVKGRMEFLSTDQNTNIIAMTLLGRNLGLSTTTPLAKLDVVGTISASDAIQVGSSALTCTSGIPGAIRYNSGSLEYCNSTSWTSLASAGAAANPDRIISGTSNVIANQDGDVVTTRAGSERIRLTPSSLNISGSLSVRNENRWSSISSDIFSDVHHGAFRGNRARGTQLSPTAVNNDWVTLFDGYGYDGNTYQQAAGMVIAATGNWASAVNGEMSFYTTENGASSARMGINPQGNIGIGLFQYRAQLGVSGTISATGAIQVGTSTLTCTNGIPGAMRYNSGSLEYCNGSAWISLASSAAAEAATDRIVSGTTSIIAYQDRSLTFTTSGTQRMIIDDRGYVGIGLVSPTAPLHVAGDVRGLGIVATDNFSYNGQFYVRGSTGLSLANYVVMGWTPGGASGGQVDTSLYRHGAGVLGLFAGAQNAALKEPTGTLLAGRIGIGTATPTVAVEVSGTISATNIFASQIITATYFEGDGSRLTNLPGGISDRIVSGTTSIVANQDRSLTFTTSGTQRMVVGDSGRVGIGTATPVAQFEVFGPVTPEPYPFNLMLTDDAATAANVGGGLGFRAQTNVGSWLTIGGIQGGKENATPGDYGGTLRFFTRANGSPNAERMRIASDGRVGIGDAPDGGHKLTIRTTENSSGTGITINSPGAGRMVMLPSAANGNMNPLVESGDTVLGFTGGSIGSGRIAITPWSNSRAGLRMDAQGNVSVTGVIQVPASTLACSTGVSGSIRYSSISSTMEYCNGSAWAAIGAGGSALGDRITSGTLAMIANSETSVVSLSTAGTTWGYLSNVMSYLPRINAERVSSSLVSSTYVQLSSATDVLSCTAARAGTLRYVSGSLQLCDSNAWKGLGGAGEWYQVGRAAQNDISVGAAIAFNSGNGNTSAVSLNTGNGRLTLLAGNTYKLMGKMRIVPPSPTGSVASIAWYNHTTSSLMGTGGVYITADTNEAHSNSELAIAFLTPAVNTEVELRVLYVNQAGIDVADLFGSVEVLMTGVSNGGGASALSDLTDVSIAGATTGSILSYNGSAWVVSSSSNGLSDRIVSGTSNITVHQNASITFAIAGTQHMIIDERGLMGIGTAAPSATAHVSGSLMVAGNDNRPCGPGMEGLIRRNAANGRMEICR